ncbi:vacuolar acid trehalase [Kluyveromyces marxianus]|uniref:alpha,alpha-trehalase n=1 Tax=Kluyveromyces marxianus TaxID=4911 RepID=A0ABX6F174_KLUMA|nr:vacuolar acid trehalase [Kluyveromyces marxianus]
MIIIPLVVLVFTVLAPVYFYVTKPESSTHSLFPELAPARISWPFAGTCASSSGGEEDPLYCPDAYRKASEKMYDLLKDNEYAFYDETSETLGNLLLSENTFSRQPYVANGYIGSRIPNVGFGFAYDAINIWVNDSAIPGALNNGWPLRNQRYAGSFVSDFYSLQEKLNSTNFAELDKDGYSTVISSIPDWTDLSIMIHRGPGENNVEYINPTDVKLDKITDYMQNLSMRDGIVTTKFVYDNNLFVTTRTLAHRSIYPLGIVDMEIELLPQATENGLHEASVELEICDTFNFTTSHRTVLADFGHDKKNEGIYMIVEPENVPYSNASMFSYFDIPSRDEYTVAKTNDLVSQCTRRVLTTDSRENSTFIVRKFTGIVSSEYDNNNPEHMSNLERATAVVMENKGDYKNLLKMHRDHWKRLYADASIEIPSDGLLEMTAKSSIYHLLANSRSHNVSQSRGLPVPPSGLSSDSYGGMVFWDADVWMLPALLPFFPEIAKQMSAYRNASLAQAKENAKKYGLQGAIFPWTSGRFANCTSTGPCVDYEYHINVDIALSSLYIYMSGEEDEEKSEEYLRYTTWPFIENAAKMFTDYVKWNDTLQQYTTHNLTDPDEFANHVDNGAFTNAGIKSIMGWAHDIANHLGLDPDPKWTEIAEKIHIPISDTNITLEYTGMNSSVDIKQADVVLMTYPLGYFTETSQPRNAIKDIYYYSERQSASGPAMTYPVFVAASASLLNSGSSSQSYLYKSVVPYLRSPFAQFSEQSDDNFLTNGLTQPAFPFLTANGGYLQSILFGLTGLRYSYEVDKDTGKMHRLLKFNPISLPMFPGGIRINNFKYMGQVLDILLTDNEGIIKHKKGNKSILIKIPDRGDIPDVKPDEYTQINGTSVNVKRAVPSGESYHTIEPGTVFKTPLYNPKRNMANNIVESKRATNITVGVPGDVAVSAIDGNNYTHWQPANKKQPGRILIDMGNGTANEIKSGKILWGNRPAKSFSLSILPQFDQITQNMTSVLSQPSSHNCSNDDGWDSNCKYQEEEENIDAAIKDVFEWYGMDLQSVIENYPELSNVSMGFIKLVDHYNVTPSYPWKNVNSTRIELTLGNETNFVVDYSKVPELNLNNNLGVDLQSKDTRWRKPRFVVLTVFDTYDDDDEVKGATIKELSLFDN